MKALTFAAAGVVAAGAVGIALPTFAADVTPLRLENAKKEPHNWLTVYGSYDSHMHSNLVQINRNNVSQLKLKFLTSIGGTAPSSVGGNPPSQQATPLVDDGFLYVNNAHQEVIKIDVRNGSRGLPVWKFDPEVELTGAMRGIALLGDSVFLTSRDAIMYAIDRNSGEARYEMSIAAPESETTLSRPSGAPLAVKDMIIAGNSAGSGGNRAWIGGFAAEDGSMRWRFWVIPGPGEPGHESWADDHNAYLTGGGAIWTTGSYDPETELVLFGTGDPAPWGDPVFRPGDNLYSVSVVALDVNNGNLNWYFQEMPNESWDFDTVNPRILYDIQLNGVMRKVQGNFSRNGFYYTLDRTSGEFLSANAYMDNINWTAGIDQKTGKPLEYDPNVMLQNYNGMSNRPGVPLLICPNYFGAPTYFPPTYDAKRMTSYVGTSVGCFNNQLIETKDVAVDWQGKSMGANWERSSEGRQLGQIVAVDVRTGMRSNNVILPYPIYSGVMSTSGDLLFTAFLDGKVAAYDLDTLSEVWSYHTGTPISAPPISYAVDGNQYIAILIGGQNRASTFNAPELGLFQTGTAAIAVFGL